MGEWKEYILEDVIEKFIDYRVKTSKKANDGMSGSSGRQRAQAHVIKEYEIKVPPLAVIEELNRQFVGLLPKLKNNANQIRTLEKLRDTLLPKLMNGEVRVQSGQGVNV